MIVGQYWFSDQKLFISLHQGHYEGAELQESGVKFIKENGHIPTRVIADLRMVTSVDRVDSDTSKLFHSIGLLSSLGVDLTNIDLGTILPSDTDLVQLYIDRTHVLKREGLPGRNVGDLNVYTWEDAITGLAIKEALICPYSILLEY